MTEPTTRPREETNQAEVGQDQGILKFEEEGGENRNLDKKEAAKEAHRLSRLRKNRNTLLKNNSVTRSASVFAFLPGEKDFERRGLPLPKWELLPFERVLKRTFDPVVGKWESTPAFVRIDPNAFAAGGVRRVHFMQMRDSMDSSASLDLMVAKVLHGFIAETEADFRSLYSQDVKQQMIAKYYATRYNRYKPVKPVDFLPAYLVELIDRNPKREDFSMCGAEHYISGHYCKWNNNYGYVHQSTRNTPQAFSHFSWEASNHTLLICDIQGVGDVYTDPVIHTMETEGSELFSGNLGKRGIQQFLTTHQCNPLCRALNLPPINPMQTDKGTMPASHEDTDHRVSYVRLDIAALQSEDVLSVHPQPSLAESVPLLPILAHSEMRWLCCPGCKCVLL